VKQEDKWLDYDDDEIEVSLEVSESVFEFIINDTIQCLFGIKEDRYGLKNT
jgi:hypothetical protein